MALRKIITPSWARERTRATARQARFRSRAFFLLRAVGNLCSSPKERNTPHSLKGIVWRAWARLTILLSEDRTRLLPQPLCGQRSVGLRQREDKKLGQDALSSCLLIEGVCDDFCGFLIFMRIYLSLTHLLSEKKS